ncbi:hypothetical protein SAMN05421874_13311 [Nonomuraea maritima]|uniref:Uncharacterized protein n=1 Tax=Nonomuraea maritima TaxID=683260 RepID=A0A1G9P347_9ACTN|nr:hypothetical protein [Nonomuraea maritima]SDL93089.1 hypothetical protein SAMN05421874_13311 [Nonomuraea maritima]
MTETIMKFGDRLLENFVPRMTAHASGPCQCVRYCCVRFSSTLGLTGTYIEHCFSGSACTGCRVTSTPQSC